MSAQFSQYAEKKILEHALGKSAWTMPTIYLALCSTLPTTGMTGTEVEALEIKYGSYKRLKIESSWLESAVSGTPSYIRNGTEFVWPELTSGESEVNAFAGCDALTKGNLIFFGETLGSVSSKNKIPKMGIHIFKGTLL
jgi:hypothetical protein